MAASSAGIIQPVSVFSASDSANGAASSKHLPIFSSMGAVSGRCSRTALARVRADHRNMPEFQ